MDEVGGLTQSLDELAEALPFLLARDDERPHLWRSAVFADQVSTMRSRVAAILDPHGLVGRVRRLGIELAPPADPPVVGAEEDRRPGRFESAARRLGRDPVAVALAIRWLEIRSGTRLPTWDDLMRRRVMVPQPAGSESAFGRDASIWFG
jgi:hypothetical protein